MRGGPWECLPTPGESCLTQVGEGSCAYHPCSPVVELTSSGAAGEHQAACLGRYVATAGEEREGRRLYRQLHNAGGEGYLLGW